MSPRLYGAWSFGLLGAYAAAIQLSQAAGGPGFGALEPFPLGGLPGQGGALSHAVALCLGLSLGWGVPGVSLALLTNPRLTGPPLLARSLGLGVGYLFVAGLGYAVVTGHAPHRAALLIELAVPCAALCLRPAVATDGQRRPFDPSIVLAAVLVAVLTAALWPKLHAEGMNGDGTEAYELSRSLESNVLPRWDMEWADPPGRFGTPITVPFFTGAYLVFGEMAILGKGELAIRIPFVTSFVMIIAAAVALCLRRTASAWVYIAAVAAVYLLLNAYFVGYEAPLDLAEPAGTDTLTIALWMAGLVELLGSSPALGMFFMSLAVGTTYFGPPLSAIVLGALLLLDRPRLMRAAPWAAAFALVGLGTLGVVGWRAGDLAVWVREFRGEYLWDLMLPALRVPSTPFFVQAILLTGALPFVIPFTWTRLSPPARVMSLTGLGYLGLVLASSNKTLHYLMPLPWLLLAPSLEHSTTRLRLAATAVLVGVFALAWPTDRAIRRETIVLGTQSCVRELDVEPAALAADSVIQVFDQPARGDRFGVGKHTFVRYAKDLGGTDCVVGFSPEVPAGATTLIDGPPAFWTTDPDRYARWRFTQVPMATSWLFPRPARPRHSDEVATWTGRIGLSDLPGRWLLVTGFKRADARSPVVTGRARLLVPVPDAEHGDVRLGLQAQRSAQMRVRLNGETAPEVDVPPNAVEAVIRGPWRSGWNVLELAGAEGVTVESLEVRPGPGR